MSNAGRPKETLEVRATWTRVPWPKRLSKRRRATLLPKILAAAWDQFLATGELPEGFDLRLEWRNPDNRNPLHSDWKSSDDDDQSLAEARDTLNRGGWLSAAAIDWEV